MRIALITGASGYIGSNLARRLIQEGVEVHILVRSSSPLELLEDIKKKITVHRFFGEISELLNIFREVHPDTVFHLAARFEAEHSPEQIQKMVESNILFGVQLLEATVMTGIRHFVNTGSHWEHYNTSEYCPANLYAATKRAFEDIAHFYVSACDLRLVTLKLIDTYGPFDPRSKVLSVLKEAAKTGRKLEMSEGEQQLGLLYIDDVATAFLMAEEHARKMPAHSKKSFIAAPKEIYTLKEVVKIVEQVWGVELHVEFGKRKYRAREMMEVCCRDENILADVNTVALSEGLKKVMELETGKDWFPVG